VYDWRFSHPGRGLSGNGAAQPRAGADQLVDVTWRGAAESGARAESGADALAIIEIVTRRPGIAPEPATIFLRWNGQGYQVVGITHGDPEG
jgi:hypothetical protein